MSTETGYRIGREIEQENYKLPAGPCKQQATQANQQANRYQDQLYPSQSSLVGRQCLLRKPVAANCVDQAHHGIPLTPG